MRKKFNYIQPWGTYLCETIVSIGTNYDEILAYCKKIDCRPENIKALEHDKEIILKLSEDHKGFCSRLPYGSLLWMKEYFDDWSFYQTLVHESFHLVYGVLGIERGMEKEEEAMAYQQEFLFREIRRKLYNHFKRYGKKNKRKTARTKRKRNTKNHT